MLPTVLNSTQTQPELLQVATHNQGMKKEINYEFEINIVTNLSLID